VHVARGGGPGGQKRNVTESAVRLRHRPTGLCVRCDETRSQRRNLALALQELARRLAVRAERPKPRRPTRISAAARRRRTEAKRRRAQQKALRRKPGSDG